jgi:hypothetical protein
MPMKMVMEFLPNYQFACAPSGIYTATAGGDCNDNNAGIHPAQQKFVITVLMKIVTGK